MTAELGVYRLTVLQYYTMKDAPGMYRLMNPVLYNDSTAWGVQAYEAQ